MLIVYRRNARRLTRYTGEGPSASRPSDVGSPALLPSLQTIVGNNVYPGLSESRSSSRASSSTLHSRTPSHLPTVFYHASDPSTPSSPGGLSVSILSPPISAHGSHEFQQHSSGLLRADGRILPLDSSRSRQILSANAIDRVPFHGQRLSATFGESTCSDS